MGLGRGLTRFPTQCTFASMMHCFRLPLIGAFLLLATTKGLAQTDHETYHRVTIALQGKSMADLAKLGIETDHGRYTPELTFTTDLAESELKRVQAAGFATTVDIENVSAWYIRQNTVSTAREDCPTDMVEYRTVATPRHYTYGSMGGYHTYEEALAVLDDMARRYPHLISTKAMLSDTERTYEGRPLYWLRISDNPNTEEADEPEVLYTALHHAREPNGLSQLLFFMWYLLENYDTNPQVRYIVNNTALYFVPIVNPDGYVFNQQTNPQGGGMWRKNRRNNADGSYGVDLNRNYGHKWGIDNDGSSPVSNQATYRGTAPFSEPETRMVRDFCNKRKFNLAYNYHTYSNLLIYPFAYNNTLANPVFSKLAALMTVENNYKAGVSNETVGYNVNGSSDDWMYAQRNVLAFTPEVGDEGFWPPQTSIDRQNKDNLWANLALALAPLNSVRIEDKGTLNLDTRTFTLPFRLQGISTRKEPFTVKIQALHPNVQATGPTTWSHSGLDVGETVNYAPTFEANAVLLDNQPLSFVVSVSYANFTFLDTLRRVYRAKINRAYTNDFSTESGWLGGWGLTTESYASPPTALTDSPFSNYGGNHENSLLVMARIPPKAQGIQLRFKAKWSLIPNAHFLAVSFSEDKGNSWMPLCGKYTKACPALGYNVPYTYCDVQRDWVSETMKIPVVNADELYIEWRLVVNTEQRADGFYLDDVELIYFLPDDATVRSVSLPESAFRHVQQPNPVHSQLNLTWPQDVEVVKIEIVQASGLVMWEHDINDPTCKNANVNTQNWPNGWYVSRLYNTNGTFSVRSFLVQH